MWGFMLMTVIHVIVILVDYLSLYVSSSQYHPTVFVQSAIILLSSWFQGRRFCEHLQIRIFSEPWMSQLPEAPCLPGH